MVDVFISYSTSDEAFARFMHKHLTDEGISVFLASVNLAPGHLWAKEILEALNSAAWVLFLASRAACNSPWVQQELGIAIATKKQLLPIVWDIQPSQLPGWVGQTQALNLAGKSTAEVRVEITIIAERIKNKKKEGLVLAGLLLAGIVLYGKGQ